MRLPLTTATALVALGLGSASARGPSDGSKPGGSLPEPKGMSLEEWEAKNGPGEGLVTAACKAGSLVL